MERLRAGVVICIVAILLAVVWQAGSTAPSRARAAQLSAAE